MERRLPRAPRHAAFVSAPCRGFGQSALGQADYRQPRVRYMTVDGIILAAGVSRRMGRNKLLLPFRGKPLLAHVLELALRLPLDTLTLVTRQETASGFVQGGGIMPGSILTVFNERPEKGMSESIRVGLRAAGGDGYLFFVADQPLLDITSVNAVLGAADAESIVAPSYGGVPGNPVFFAAKFRDELMTLEGDAGGKLLRDRHPDSFRLVAVPGAAALRDVDTPAEYARLLAFPDCDLSDR